MRIIDGKIVEATEAELFDYWLKQYDEIYSYPWFRLKMIELGVNIITRKEDILDSVYFDYACKRKGITAKMLDQEMDWSPSTGARRRSGETDWQVSELRKLYKMGFTAEEIEKIFFSSGSVENDTD